MTTPPSEAPDRYTVTCVHCGRVIFRDARHLGQVQFTMIQSHVLLCRPLEVLDLRDLTAHCKVVNGSL